MGNKVLDDSSAIGWQPQDSEKYRCFVMVTSSVEGNFSLRIRQVVRWRDEVVSNLSSVRGCLGQDSPFSRALLSRVPPCLDKSSTHHQRRMASETTSMYPTTSLVRGQGNLENIMSRPRVFDVMMVVQFAVLAFHELIVSGDPLEVGEECSSQVTLFMPFTFTPPIDRNDTNEMQSPKSETA